MCADAGLDLVELGDKLRYSIPARRFCCRKEMNLQYCVSKIGGMRRRGLTLLRRAGVWDMGIVSSAKTWTKKYGRKPILVVVGAAGGIDWRWATLGRQGGLRCVGFEPSESDCEKLLNRQPWAEFKPFPLGNTTGPASLHVTKFSECSSCLPPDKEVLAPYPVREGFEVTQILPIKVYRYLDLVSMSSHRQSTGFSPIGCAGIRNAGS